MLILSVLALWFAAGLGALYHFRKALSLEGVWNGFRDAWLSVFTATDQTESGHRSGTPYDTGLTAAMVSFLITVLLLLILFISTIVWAW